MSVLDRDMRATRRFEDSGTTTKGWRFGGTRSACSLVPAQHKPWRSWVNDGTPDSCTYSDEGMAMMRKGCAGRESGEQIDVILVMVVDSGTRHTAGNGTSNST